MNFSRYYSLNCTPFGPITITDIPTLRIACIVDVLAGRALDIFVFVSRCHHGRVRTVAPGGKSKRKKKKFSFPSPMLSIVDQPHLYSLVPDIGFQRNC